MAWQRLANPVPHPLLRLDGSVRDRSGQQQDTGGVAWFGINDVEAGVTEEATRKVACPHFLFYSPITRMQRSPKKKNCHSRSSTRRIFVIFPPVGEKKSVEAVSVPMVP